MASKVFEHPFDLTKVRLQSQVLDATARFKGPTDCLTRTFKDEGVRGLYRVRRLFPVCMACGLIHLTTGIARTGRWRHGRKCDPLRVV